MHKSLIVILIILGMLSTQFLWAASSSEAEERAAKARKQMEEMQQKQQEWKTKHPVGKREFRGPVGKYQAVRLSEEKVLILDTAGGNLWLWEAKGGKEPQYQGRIPEIKK